LAVNNVVMRIQQQFIQEATHSPLLLSDLASMETYIAESYRDRSFIELLQNADDANSKRFIIKRTGHFLIVANDGRLFTENDLIAICRSGASTKKRGGSSIGYRGIGFKSVVNLAERVHIISGELRMTFCRKLSSQLLNMAVNVPLIRIPHLIDNTVENQLKTEIEELLDDQFNTLFIFENVKQTNLDVEFEQFDSSSLLFLRNVRQVEFLSDFSKIITLKRKITNGVEFISIKDQGQEDWLVHRDAEGNAGIAFLIQDSEVCVLEDTRSVIHSFMPTKDPVGLPIKIHGDFSTDPSRTKVIHDEYSVEAFNKCAKLLVDLIKFQLEGKIQISGLFHLLESIDMDTTSIIARSKPRRQFIEVFKEMIKTIDLPVDTTRKPLGIMTIKLKPEWLNQQDYLQACEILGYVPFREEYEIKHPGLTGFLKKVGVPVLSILEALQFASIEEPSLIGSTEILAKCIHSFRFNLTDEAKTLIKKAKFIMFVGKRYIPLNDLTETETIDVEYFNRLKLVLNDIKDLNWFFKQLSVRVNIPEDEPHVRLQQNNSRLEIQSTHSSVTEKTSTLSMSSMVERTVFSSIRKWRSVEINLKHMLEQEPDVQRVIDVSKSNLGYDLEVHRTTGIEFYEVKSVDEIGAPFSLTNNEYATANEKSDKYVLAIVKQTKEGLEVCFLRDPINNLTLTKRVTRWEWVCDEYSGKYISFPFTD